MAVAEFFYLYTHAKPGGYLAGSAKVARRARNGGGGREPSATAVTSARRVCQMLLSARRSDCRDRAAQHEPFYGSCVCFYFFIYP